MTVYIIALVIGGVLDTLLGFAIKEKALAWVEEHAKLYNYHKDNEDHWTSIDEDDDMTLWEVKIE